MMPVSLRSLCRNCLFLAVCGSFASAWAQDSISPPISGSIGDPLFSESTQGGPSTSLVPGDTTLTGPYIRSGVSDPLGFLIETGQMSPFAFTTLDSGSRSDAPQPILNDPIRALQYGEYRNNRFLMAGAAVRSTPTGRSSAAGGSLQGGFRSRAQSNDSSAFLQPFSAGSSLSTAASPGFTDPSKAGFTDPGKVGGLDATTLAAVPMAGSGAGSAPSAADASAMMSMMSASPSGLGASMAPTGLQDAVPGAAVSSQVRVYGTGADAMPVGPLPGQPFPDNSISIVSPLGFADSTMGTAGQQYMEDASRRQAGFESSRFTGAASSPFPDFGSSTFLHPSLHGSGPAGSRTLAPVTMISAQDALRKERKKAIIAGRQFTPPTSFALHSMERSYMAERRKGQRRPSLLAPSVTQTTTSTTTY